MHRNMNWHNVVLAFRKTTLAEHFETEFDLCNTRVACHGFSFYTLENALYCVTRVRRERGRETAFKMRWRQARQGRSKLLTNK